MTGLFLYSEERHTDSLCIPEMLTSPVSPNLKISDGFHRFFFFFWKHYAGHVVLVP